MVELLQDHCGPSGHRCPIVVVQTLPAESEHRQVAAVEKQIDLAHAPSRNPDSGRSPLLRDEGLKPQHPRGECAISQGIIGEQPPASVDIVGADGCNEPVPPVVYCVGTHQNDPRY